MILSSLDFRARGSNNTLTDSLALFAVFLSISAQRVNVMVNLVDHSELSRTVFICCRYR